MSTALRNCPRCGLTNPPGTTRCDCGYRFDSTRPSRSDQAHQPLTRQKLRLAVKIAAGMAFFQATVTALYVVALLTGGDILPGGNGISLYSLIDVIALTGFALALVKGRLWAAYGLLGYGLLDWIVKAMRFGQIAWILPVVLYAIGAITLARSEHLAPAASELRWKRTLVFAAVLIGGNFLIGFLFGLFGLTRGGVAQGWAATLTQTCLSVIWNAAVCFLAVRQTAWPFETALLLAIFSAPVGPLEMLVTGESPITALARVVWTIAFCMIGWGGMTLFPPKEPIPA